MDKYAYITLPSILIKADKKEKDILYLEASNPQVDQQREKVLPSALEDEAHNFLKSGVISWDHQHKIRQDPSYIIGEPLDVRVGKKRATLVKARIYRDCRYGRAVLELAKSACTRLGASIGGFIVKRVTQFDAALKKSIPTIAKILWDEVAITHRAVNAATAAAGGGQGVSITPFAEFAKSWILDEAERAEVIKGLTAGYGTDAAAYAGGRALQKESLMGAKEPMDSQHRRHLQGAFVDLLRHLSTGQVRHYGDLTRVLRAHGAEDAADEAAKLIVENKDRLKRMLPTIRR